MRQRIELRGGLGGSARYLAEGGRNSLELSVGEVGRKTPSGA